LTVKIQFDSIYDVASPTFVLTDLIVSFFFSMHAEFTHRFAHSTEQKERSVGGWYQLSTDEQLARNVCGLGVAVMYGIDG
jgi:hypothetical protein